MANKYSPIWDTLKKDSHITLAIPPALQKRVIKAVINLKNRDDIFRLEAEAKKKRYILGYVKESARVRIFLREYDNLSAVAACDL